jgi:hypothetical protein
VQAATTFAAVAALVIGLPVAIIAFAYAGSCAIRGIGRRAPGVSLLAFTLGPDQWTAEGLETRRRLLLALAIVALAAGAPLLLRAIGGG